ncbi:MAG: exodeoxyribonuclease V subunit gamma [Fibrobacteres bacterium]|nr:exodeoxyribonuclease V subunit gamma [Fibrobacterota bacterium]
MSSLILHTSNTLESLADDLSRLIAIPSAAPFETETIIVQSSGMEKWLRFQIADRLGVAANLAFPFPNSFLSSSFKKVLTETPFEKHFARDPLTWKIFKLLTEKRELLGESGFSSSLEDDIDRIKQYTLSDILADLFDQYAIYRPQWIDAWQSGKSAVDGDSWQAAIYRELSAVCCGETRLAALKNFETKLRTEKNEFDLPKRISVFGISSLPPFHIRGLELLSMAVEVHMFILNPCREHWFNIMPDTTQEKIRLLSHDDAVMLHLDESNSLLGNFGTQGREFISAIHQLASETSDNFIEPDRNALLPAIQDDILKLSNASKDNNPYKVSRDDTSLRIHVCHSTFREVQILYDALLDRFNKDATLLPREIIVMAPDIEKYASAVNAVFGNPQNDSLRIPFSIADSSDAAGSSYADAFSKLLHLQEKRLTANEIIDLLTNRSIASHFAITDTDIQTIKKWFTELNTSWGLDADHKAELSLPTEDFHTLAAASERLLLGYLLPHNREDEAFDRFPFNRIEGEQAELAGRLTSLFSTIKTARKTLSENYSAEEWTVKLEELMNNWATAEEEDTNAIINSALDTLKKSSISAEFTEKLPLQIIRKHLTDRISRTASSKGFLSSGVTFCSMLPMRCIPFKGIALLGMDSSYPRESFPVSFDLMRTAGSRKTGDRSRDLDDRYIFLETLISARKWLHISYVGKNIENNSVLSPSPLINDLSDFILSNTQQDKKEAEKILFIHHPLHFYSSEYFTNPDLPKTYSPAAASVVASAKSDNRIKPERYITEPLSEPDTGKLLQITPEEFISPFLNSARFFMEKALNIRFDKGVQPLQDHEPFYVNSKTSASVKRTLIGCTDVESRKKLFRKSLLSAELPPSNMAEYSWGELSLDAEEIIKASTQLLESDKPSLYNIDILLTTTHIKGTIRAYQGIDGYVFINPVKATASLKFITWINHLMLNKMSGSSETSLIDKEVKTTTFTPVETPLEILRVIEKTFLKAYSEPLPFTPEASLKFVEEFKKNPSLKRSLDLAADLINPFEDPYIKHVWLRNNMTDHQLFPSLAESLLSPMIQGIKAK